MNILFAHQNFPGQFGGFAKFLSDNGWSVSFATAKEGLPQLPWCQLIKMTPHRDPTPGVHRFARGLEKAMINGQAFANAGIKARNAGISPDIVVGHSGWGSGTFAKAVWPDCRYVAYVEWYYRWPPVDDVSTDRKQNLEDGRANALARNTPTLLDLAEADLVFCPTDFQAMQFPPKIRRDFVVMPDGVDARKLAPDRDARAPLPEGRSLPEDAEIVTYATRGMEPHRGFPEFMRAIQRLQKTRPNLHVVVGGEDRVAYGPQLPDGDSWKKRMLSELDLDLDRVHFTGLLPRDAYTRLMQSSTVHVYLTVPFVLSWSLIEAMSIGCALVASDVAPVRDAIRDRDTASLVDHTDIDALTSAIDQLLDDAPRRAKLGENARNAVLQNFDILKIYPERAKLLEETVRQGG